MLPTPPPEMVGHVTGNAAYTAEEYRAPGRACAVEIFNTDVIVTPSAKVLGIGCGCGRVSQFILPLLSGDGAYLGLDTWGTGIQWASKNIATVYPQSSFRSLGNGDNYDATSAFPFGVIDGSFDAAIAISLFTHLRKNAAVQYFKQIYNALRPGGRAYLTFFANKQRFRECWPEIICDEDDYGIYFVKPEFEDAFLDEGVLIDTMTRIGFAVAEKRYGYWRGDQYVGRGQAGYQDLFVVERR
jgi:cyclopropane fatty-acyl-phospholipid synthase-like methyltransferase